MFYWRESLTRSACLNQARSIALSLSVSVSSVHSVQREEEEEEIVEGRGRDGKRGRQMNGSQEDVGRKNDENKGNKEGWAEEKVISGREGRMEGRDTGQIKGKEWMNGKWSKMELKREWWTEGKKIKLRKEAKMWRMKSNKNKTKFSFNPTGVKVKSFLWRKVSWVLMLWNAHTTKRS